MKFNLNICLLLLPVIAGCLFAGCRKPNLLSNAVFLADASLVNSAKITVDSMGASYDIVSRTSQVAEQQIEVSYSISEGELTEYNKQNGTAYKLLPAAYYSFNATSATIAVGNAFSIPVPLMIKDLKGLPENESYAIPVTIDRVSGTMQILRSSKTVVLVIDRVIYTSVPHLTGSALSTTYKTPFKGITAWTFEWRVQMDALNRNNQALIFSYPSEVYTRFGDVVIRPTQLQVKTANSQFSPEIDFQPGTWYHFALVYDGGSLKWYQDGKQILNVPLSASYNFESIGFGGGSERVNEIRFWTVARTPSQIANNMYTVNPSSEGLAGYWRCNEGTGNIFADSSPNKNDMKANVANVEWTPKVRMPAK
ncbi:MAG TPA: DUF1735 domain-containing protein [Chitinophaga sp.]|uniref:BT_3987 domain-containing protein n=1 Tax=Chitinophaga sp. TaxID=1869181 RepID=UPI002C9EC4E9|nr:DUF1735 domain-containing protein [Chitinophaga sp.]HVI45637.1 DUF1735 domain-containing protein [Chitinophaga sp.]